MPLKPCLGSALHPLGHTLSRGRRCPECQRHTDNQRYAKRGTTKQRGLSGVHANVSRSYRDNNLACVECGEHGTPDNPITAGHIIARARGGRSELHNYQPECLSCNSAKGDRA